MAGWCWASLIPSLEQFPSQLHNYIRMAEEGAQGRKWAVGAGLWWGRRVLKATSADTAAKRNVNWITAQWHVQPNPVEVLSVRDIILLSSPVCFDVIYSAPVCLAAPCHSGKAWSSRCWKGKCLVLDGRNPKTRANSSKKGAGDNMVSCVMGME